MSLQGIFDPMVRAYFAENGSSSSGGSGADELIAKIAHGERYELKSDAVYRVSAAAFRYYLGLAAVDFPNAEEVYGEAFAYCTGLASVKLAKAKTISISTFKGCINLKTVDLGMVENIDEEAFSGCNKLSAVIIRTTSTVCVADLTAFDGTPMLQGTGHIYVPSSMYEMYRAGYAPKLQEGMFDILFRKIEDYPEIVK